jgi:hypothetical protein
MCLVSLSASAHETNCKNIEGVLREQEIGGNGKKI